MRRLATGVVALCVAASAGAQTPDVRHIVFGTVMDSLTNRPLVGAVVAFVRAEGSDQGRQFVARSDANATYAIQLPAGTYMASFRHAMLDSTGIEVMGRRVDVSGGPTAVHFGTPSPTTLVRTLCGASSAAETVLIGHVRSVGDGAPVDSATVLVWWVDWQLANLTVASTESVMRTASDAEGWFGFCGLPPGVPLLVRAQKDSMSTGAIPAVLHSRWLHRGLRLGEASLVDAGPSAASERRWSGTHRIGGVVLDSSGATVARASIAVIEAARETSSAADGSFVLDSLPGGTWPIEIRRVGYEPQTRVVELGGPASTRVEIRLARNPVALAEAAVSGRSDAELSAFYRRMSDAEKGTIRGFFIDRLEIQRRNEPLVTNLLEGLTGVRVTEHPDSDAPRKRVVLGANGCRMTVYLDQVRILPRIDGTVTEELNELVRSTSLAGVEVYARSELAPRQFQSVDGVCGVVLLWSR